jgi:YebC/PmpR family DNA-binding regulatory protein
MSGHSKWSQIKRKKGLKDQEKGRIFSKLARAITIAVLEGGGSTDPDHNVKLRMTLDKAKHENMPKENIKRAIDKGVGPGKESLHEMIYEGFGPKGTVFLIQVATDNSNRTHSEVKSVLEKHHGKSGTQGSVSYLFQKCAVISFDEKENKEEDIYTFADKVEELDLEEDGSTFTVYFPFSNLGHVKEFLGDLKPISPAELDYKPASSVKITDENTARKILNLVENLEALEDVQKVFSNFDIPEKYLKL